MKKLFLIEIKIVFGCWNYKDGQKIIIPVESNNHYNAILKLENKYCGSEYPSYTVEECTEYKFDEFLFKPILKLKK